MFAPTEIVHTNLNNRLQLIFITLTYTVHICQVVYVNGEEIFHGKESYTAKMIILPFYQKICPVCIAIFFCQHDKIIQSKLSLYREYNLFERKTSSRKSVKYFFKIRQKNTVKVWTERCVQGMSIRPDFNWLAGHKLKVSQFNCKKNSDTRTYLY